MPDPVSMALIAASGASAFGSIKGGYQQARALNYQAKINERNARAAEIAGEQIVMDAELGIGDFRESFEDFNDQTMQTARANGWAADTGTPYLIAMENARQADKEIAIRRLEARKGKQSTEETALSERMQAVLNKQSAKQARTSGYMEAGKTLLSAYAATNQPTGGSVPAGYTEISGASSAGRSNINPNRAYF